MTFPTCSWDRMPFAPGTFDPEPVYYCDCGDPDCGEVVDEEGEVCPSCQREIDEAAPPAQ